MKLIFTFLFFIISIHSYTQVLNYGADTSLCLGDEIELVGVPFDTSQVIQLTNPDSLLLMDDRYSQIIDLGFDFTFYDSTYSQVVIGQNGILSFDSSKVNAFCPYLIFTSIPNDSIHTNNIMFPYMDIASFSTSAPFVYETIGIAPNRQFILQMKCGSLFGNCGSITITAVLSETSNEIEIHIGKKGYCNWNSNRAIQGLHNRTGTIAHAVPSRNYPNSWVASVDGKKWTPNGPNDYTISTVPYRIAMDSFSYVWHNTLGQTFPYTDTLTISGQSLNENVGYFLGLENIPPDLCSVQSIQTDTSWINQDFQPPNLEVLSDFCNASVGEIVSTSVNSVDSTYYWVDVPVYSDTLTDLSQGTYNYIYTGNNGCSLVDSIVVDNQNSFDIEVDSTICPGDTNGIATILPERA